MKSPEELCGELAQRTKAFAPYKNEIIRYLKWLVFKLDDENEKAHVKDLILIKNRWNNGVSLLILLSVDRLSRKPIGL